MGEGVRLRLAAAIFAALFLLAAIVQWNDPDPVRWILAYGAVSVLSLAAAFGQRWRLPSALLCAGLALAALFFTPHLARAPAEVFASFAMKDEGVELAREAAGLWLCFLWTLVLTLHAGRG
jgi:hypothetical protein